MQPPHTLETCEISDYREKVVLSLSTARQLAADAIRAAQATYKQSYDWSSCAIDYKVGDWVVVKFPQDETGRMRKLSRPWHGPYCNVERRDPDVTVIKVYSPQDGQIQIHQNRVTPCPPELPSGFFWYGNHRAKPGCPPKWVDHLLCGELLPEQRANDNVTEGAVMTEQPGALETVEDTPASLVDIIEDTEVPHAMAETDPLDGDQLDTLEDPAPVTPKAESPATSAYSAGASELHIPVTQQRTEPTAKGLRCYRLREKTALPARLMVIRSRSSSSRGGRDVMLVATCRL